MVHNMAPGYEAAKYDIVWVSTSRIKGESTARATNMTLVNFGVGSSMRWPHLQKILTVCIASQEPEQHNFLLRVASKNGAPEGHKLSLANSTLICAGGMEKHKTDTAEFNIG